MKQVILKSVAAIVEAMRDGYAVYSSDDRYEVKTACGELYVWDTENLCSIGALKDWVGRKTFCCYTF